MWLRSKVGKPESIQGVLSKNFGRVRIRLVEYGYDALIYRDRAPPSAQDGATVHCWLGFTLQGPIAVFQEGLHNEFGSAFELIEHVSEAHRTPMGNVQHFIYCHCLKPH